jgi:segregation and condensation protein A
LAVTDSTTFLEKKDGYKIRLSNFEGPLDLLLYLIKREEIDIYDIPIAEITRQYLDYIDLMRELDLEVAGEFILMAATLIQIKVRMLLPRHEEEDEETEEDPRADLVRRLLEYKRFKEVAESLAEIETRQRRLFPRACFSYEKSLAREKPGKEEPLVHDISMFDLLTAFKQVLDNMPRITSHLVNMPSVTVEEQIAWIENTLKEKKRLSFSVLMGDLKDRIVIVITFMAILEMMRTRRIRIQQAALFGEIWMSGPLDQEP